MTPKHLTIALLLGLLLSVALACGPLSGITERAGSAQQTAQAAISGAKEFATQSSQLIGTAQAFATQNPSLVSTAQSFITNEGPALMATAQAVATQHPGLLETAQAAIEQGASGANLPANIPLPPGDVDILFSTGEILSLSTGLDLKTVLEFYRVEMVANGWTPVADGSFETEQSAVLNFTQAGRNASVTISSGMDEDKTYIIVNVITQ